MNNILRQASLAIAAIGTLSLGACAGSGPGQLNGYGPNYMSRIVLDRADGKPILMAQYLFAQKEAAACSERIDIQLSGAIEGITTGGVGGGAGGAAGGVGGYEVAGAASAAFAPVAAIDGVGNAGMSMWSSTVAYSANKDKLTGTCTERHLRYWQRHGYDKLLDGFSADSSSFRTKNGINKPAKGLVPTGYTGERDAG